MMPTSSSLESSLSIIKHSRVMVLGYLQRSLLSLLHLFMICLKYLLAYINVCVLIAKCPSQVQQPAQSQAGYLDLYVRHLTQIHMSGESLLPADVLTTRVLKAPFCCRFATMHGSKMLLCSEEKTAWLICTHNFLWYFRVI